MAGINGLSTGIDYSVLFGTTGSNGNSMANDSLLGLDLSAVSSIKNGSYGKLLKNYYKQSKTEAATQVGDTDAKLTGIKAGADKLEQKADALSDKKLWETKTVTKDGRQTEELADADKAVSAVKDFVKSYNAMIDEAEDSETKSVLRKTGWMANMTKQNANLLAEAGIRIGSDDKLTLDEDTFKKANVTTLKELFSGNDSYAAKVSAKAAGIGQSAANTEAIYTEKGSWPSSVSQMAEDMISKTGAVSEEEPTTEKTDLTNKTEKTTLTEEDSNKIKDLQEQKEKLQKSYGASDMSYEQFRDLDKQISDIDDQIRKLYGTV